MSMHACMHAAAGNAGASTLRVCLGVARLEGGLLVVRIPLVM